MAILGGLLSVGRSMVSNHATRSLETERVNLSFRLMSQTLTTSLQPAYLGRLSGTSSILVVRKVNV